jgi:predicted nucleic acid-binding Zn ribbon protein
MGSQAARVGLDAGQVAAAAEQGPCARVGAAVSRDPSPIGQEIDRVLRSKGWQRRLIAARLVARWAEVVGPTVANHCQPRRLEDDGTLSVVADSAAWATQLSYLQGTLLDRLATIMGPGVVKHVRVRTGDARPRGRCSRAGY